MIPILGIDPGAHGGLALLYYDRQEVWKMPETEHDIGNLIDDILFQYPDVVCYLEEVHSMPKQGVKSMFTFGTNYGILLCATRKLKRNKVPPQVWKRQLRCLLPGATNTARKALSKKRAQELFPHIKITHAISEALLISEYGRRQELPNDKPISNGNGAL